MRVKIAFNDALRHFSACQINLPKRPLATPSRGIYYTLYRKANKIQRVKETRGICKWLSNTVTPTRQMTDLKLI